MTSSRAHPGGLVLTGTRGAGKSTIAKALVERGGYGLVGAVTTRPPRPDDDGVYTYLTNDEMRDLDSQGELIVTATYGGYRYGISGLAAQDVAGRGKVPIVVITPESVVKFLSSSAGVQWAAVFIDAPDHLLDGRLEADNRTASPADIAQRRIDRRVGLAGLDVVVNDSDIASAVSAVEAAYTNG
jgi:guanylate kinase